MKNLGLVVAALSFLAMSCGFAVAQQRNDPQFNGGRAPADEHGNNHPDWRKGGRVAHDDWARGAPVDYRARHLRQPPQGYQWREVDGNFILAAVATGMISDVILNAR